MTDQTVANVRSLSPDQRKKLVEQFHAYMRDRAKTNSTERSRDVMDQQAVNILAAAEDGNTDDVWNADAGGTIQMRDIPGSEVRIYDMEPVVSTRTFEDGEAAQYGYYVSMNACMLAAPDDILQKTGLTVGQGFVLQTGAPLVMFKVRALEARGELPFECYVHETKTSSGNTVLRIRKLMKRAK